MAMADIETKTYAYDYIDLRRWKTWHILEGSELLLRSVACSVEPGSPSDWLVFARNVYNAITSEVRGNQVHLQGEGYLLTFEWPQISRIDARGLTTWHEEEPFFRLESRMSNPGSPEGKSLSESMRNIARLMSSQHRMMTRVNKEQGVFYFRKEDYSTSRWGTCRALILG